MKSPVFLLSFVLLVAYQRPTPAEMGIRRLEDELSKALVERDVRALDRLWDKDLIFITRNGRAFTKGERIESNRGAAPQKPGETNTNDEVIVRVQQNTAVVTVLSTWTTPTDHGSSSSRYRALHVWLRKNGSWRLVAAQVASVSDAN